MLKRGSRGERVKTLQYLLNLNVEPDPELVADGIFGGATDAAVRRFQRQRGLVVDGIVGPNTMAELGDLGDPANGPTPSLPANPANGGGGGSGAGGSAAGPLWMHYARQELDRGVRGIAGEQHNPRIVAYHATTGYGAEDDETAWCSSFVNWCVTRAGLQGTNAANARSWLGWGRAVQQPRYGDVVVLWRVRRDHWKGHVGFFVEFRGTDRVMLLGGNQGNRVCVSGYPLQRLLGYRTHP